jgi:phosphoribosyl 1,2-cyclic phosphate phosphodiesterase
LGSGPANSIPRTGCRCDLCHDARQGTKSARTRSSIFIQDRKSSVLIDTSPDFLFQAKRVGVKKIDAVFFTHQHADAVSGFGDFISWCQTHGESPEIFAEEATINYLKNKFPRIFKIPLRPPLRKGEASTPLLLKRRVGVDFLSTISIHRLAPFGCVKIGNISVESFRVNHGFKNIPTLGYRINGKTICISDFDGLPPRSVAYLRGAETMILDAAMWFGRKIKGHNTPKEAIAIAKKFSPKILYLMQTGHTWPPHNIAQKILNNYARKEKFKFRMRLAHDGLKIRI